ncbi:MAG: HIT domain-containing protein [Acidimicrobiaceae bacterium]|nr:HIT domain-containing protein [Acidimicrobiaceae bacterium]
MSSVSASSNAQDDGECVFCVLAQEPINEDTGVLWRSDLSFVTLNAFPYGSGHLLVLPRRHVAGIGDLGDDEYRDFSEAIRSTAVALERAYGPDGLNVGMNLGRAAGAGIPKHLHGHVLPRWIGDTNFMTSIGETRVLPESLQSTWQKLHAFL